jgi:hypothetical protein
VSTAHNHIGSRDSARAPDAVRSQASHGDRDDIKLARPSSQLRSRPRNDRCSATAADASAATYGASCNARSPTTPVAKLAVAAHRRFGADTNIHFTTCGCHLRMPRHCRVGRASSSFSTPRRSSTLLRTEKVFLPSCKVCTFSKSPHTRNVANHSTERCVTEEVLRSGEIRTAVAAAHNHQIHMPLEETRGEQRRATLNLHAHCRK